LVREGFDKASTNCIAEGAGVSIGSLYAALNATERAIHDVEEGR
jgi:hypothetical protein